MEKIGFRMYNLKKILILTLLCMSFLLNTTFASSSSINFDFYMHCKKPIKGESLTIYVDGKKLTNFEKDQPTQGLLDDPLYSATGIAIVLEDKLHTVSIEHVRKGNTRTFT